MSHVAVAKRICIVCGTKYDSNELLLHKRLGNIDPEKTVIGPGLCEPHTKIFNSGYIALIAIDPVKSGINPGQSGNISDKDAWRTGAVMFVSKEIFPHIFNLDPSSPVMYVEQQTLDFLKNKYEEDVGEPVPEDIEFVIRENQTASTGKGAEGKLNAAGD